jgi:5-methyltetrahydropteroyltriglutamate--homocysteine methyltransferase
MRRWMTNLKQRILTTHVGSLPRSAAVIECLQRKERGEPCDVAEFDAVMRQGVDEVVARQREIGIDIVSDGETSKIGYATYIKDRLSGFEGHHPRPPHKDLAPHPDFREAIGRMIGPQTFQRAACTGPIELIDPDAVNKDIENLKLALAAHGGGRAFMNAASPGVVSSFQHNRYYDTHEAYVDAIAAVMQHEYEAIAAAGFDLQLDCPDLAMAKHTGFQELSESEFLSRAECQVEALNRAVANIPPERMRMHICWGNYEGPHDHDIPLTTILDIVLRARPAAIVFEAANPRHRHEWTVWRDAQLPEDKILVPGCIDSTYNYVEHPELVAQQICQFADIVGRERVIAGTDCGFGTFAGTGRVVPDIAYKKLAALVEGAAIASRRLFGSG